jgi:uncharacterized delta-60 repeat protein
MQKVEGSNPFSRLIGSPLPERAFAFWGRCPGPGQDCPCGRRGGAPTLSGMALHRNGRSAAVALVTVVLLLVSAAVALGLVGGRAGGAPRVLTRDLGTQAASWGVAQTGFREADGSTTVLGPGESGFTVMRLKADGDLDDRFGIGGMVVGSFGIGVGEPYATDIARAPGGRIVVGGAGPEAGEVAGSFAFSRYLPDGRLDPGFGNGGNVVFGGSPPVEFGVEEMVVLRDGDIFAVGRAGATTASRHEAVEVVLVRPDGTIDRSYGQRGFFTVPVPDSNYGSDMQVQLAPGGRPIVYYGKEGGFRLIGFKADGSLDRRFGKDGVVEVEGVKEDNSGTVGMAIGPEGKIVVAGPDEVAEVEPGGGGAISFKIPLPDSLEGWSLRGRPAVDPAGRILLCGETPLRKEVVQGIVVRMLPEGGLDPSFGDGRGYVLAHGRLDGDGDIHSLLTLPDGGITALGSERGAKSPTKMLVTRYDAAGHADAAFGQNGEVLLRGREPARAVVTDLSVGGDGKVTAGAVVKGRLGLVRIGASVARTGAGSATTSVGPPLNAHYQDYGHTLAREPGGGYLLGGYSEGKGIVTRWLPGGRLDTGFGEGGVVQVPSLRKVLALRVGDAGSILVAGFGGVERTMLVRLSPRGALEQSFGDRGSVRLPIGSDRVHTMALAIGAHGEILVGGGSVYYGQVVEYTAGGRRVHSFGKKGVASGLPVPESLTAIRLDRRGRIVLAGVHNKQASVARLLPHGAPDPTFGQTDGSVPKSHPRPARSSQTCGSKLTVTSSPRVSAAFPAPPGAPSTSRSSSATAPTVPSTAPSPSAASGPTASGRAPASPLSRSPRAASSPAAGRPPKHGVAR